MSNILVLAPHMDDEVLGCGGSIAKHAASNNRVFVAYVASGKDPAEAATREAEALEVCLSLGAETPFFLRQDPASIDEHAIQDVVRIIRSEKINFIYAPHKDDGDLHHEKVHDMASRVHWLANGTAYPPIPGQGQVQGLLFYEIHRPIQDVHYLEDITPFVEKKREAMRIYASQTGTPWAEGILGLNRYRGTMSELFPYAEAFQVKGLRNLDFHARKC